MLSNIFTIFSLKLLIHIIMKEKIFIARNSEPEGSPSEYLGAEVSIGKLSSEMIDELKLLENDNLFEEMAGKLWTNIYRFFIFDRSHGY